MINLEKFGKRVKLAIQLNKYQNMSQYAKKSKLGLSTITDACRGTKSPSGETLLALSDELGVSIDWLLKGDKK